MKKIAIGVLAIGAVLLISGCTKKQAGQVPPQNGESFSQTKEESGGVINSIKDAIGLGKKMQCTYTYKAGNESFTTTAYIEGKKYKSESDMMGKKQLVIFDGDTMYNWAETDKKGTKWTKACMEELNKSNEPDETNEKPIVSEDQIENIEETFKDAMDVKCTDVSSIDFSVPTDIVFTDQCEILKAQMKKFEEMKKNLPSGANIPGNVNIPDNAGL